MGRKLFIMGLGLLLISISSGCGKSFVDTVWVGQNDKGAVTIQFMTKNTAKLYWGSKYRYWGSDYANRKEYVIDYKIEDNFLKITHNNNSRMIKIESDKLVGNNSDFFYSDDKSTMILTRLNCTSKDYTPFTELALHYDAISNVYIEALNSIKNVKDSNQFITQINNISDKFLREWDKGNWICVKFAQINNLNFRDINTIPNNQLKIALQNVRKHIHEFEKPETKSQIDAVIKNFGNNKEVERAITRLYKATKGNK